MSEDGEKDQEKNEETSSRPVSASARRKQRSSGDAASGDGGSGDTGAGKRPAPKGKGSGGSRSSAATRDKGQAKTEGKGEPTPKRDGKARRQESLFARVVRFLREVWGELKKVVWPTRKQMGTYTAVVLVFLAFMIALVFGLDFVWGQAVSFVFGG